MSASDNGPGNQGSPPDATGAIGPGHYVEIVNRRVAVYNRFDLGLESAANLDTFVGAPAASVFDPQIQWDQQAGRWLYLAVDVEGEGNNFLAFGWSKTSDPSNLGPAGWCRYGVSTGSDILDDYPKLGHSNNHLIFGANAVYAEALFLTARIWTVAKPTTGQTTCPGSLPTFYFGSPFSPLTTADGDTAFTPVPANTTDSSADGYVVAADYPLFVDSPSQVMAWHVGGPPDDPTLTEDGNFSVSGFDVPADVPQPGTANLLDSLDARLTQAVARVDPDASGLHAVWTQHTVAGPGGRSVARWYELLPATLTLRQQGSIQSSSDFVFNGAISPGGNGRDAVINYNVGSGSQLASVRAQSRKAAMALGTMAQEITLATSAAADQDFTCSPGPCRWGDYAGASPDPLNGSVVWGSNQLNGPFTEDPHWATRNFAVTAAELGYARPKAASPSTVRLVPAYESCTGPNGSHGSPLVMGSCNPPVQSSDYLTVGSPDANGKPANFAGSLVLKVVGENPIDPANGDQADVEITGSLTDVRKTSDLSDYTGELRVVIGLRVTDRYNGSSFESPATVTDAPLAFNVSCSATGGPEGGTCNLATTADAVVSGLAREGQRAIWELGQLDVFDGGADADADTGDNTLFAVQGTFVP